MFERHCNGVIIDDYAVLTTVGCVHHVNGGEIFAEELRIVIRAQQISTSNYLPYHDVGRIVSDPKYNHHNKSNDIAVLLTWNKMVSIEENKEKQCSEAGKVTLVSVKL